MVIAVRHIVLNATATAAKKKKYPMVPINQSIRKIFNVSRITNVIARSTET